MRSKTALGLLAAMAFLLIGTNVQCQRQMFKDMPPMPPLPEGFQPPNPDPPNPWRAAGMGDGKQGEKKNQLPKCFGVPAKASIGYSWMAGGQQFIIDAQLRQPEAPPQNVAGFLEEPAGKSSYRGGMIVYRKTNFHATVGIDAKGECGGTIEGWSVNWQGVVNGKMLAISLLNYYGGKAEAQSVVDGLIGKLIDVAQRVK
jgi:hypothetical protein